MAVTRISSADNATVKQWSDEIFVDARFSTWLQNLMGKTPSSAIFEFKDLSKGSGDRVRFNLYASNENDRGRVDNETLEGYEADPTPTTDDIEIHKYRHAMRFEGDLNDLRLATSLPAVCKSKLQDWVTKKMERLVINTCTGKGDGTATGMNEAISHFALPASRGSKAAIVATDLLTPAQISRAKYMALQGQAATAGTNHVRPALRPIRIDGGEYLVAVIHPYQAFDLVRNTEFTQARREAEVRGKENPLFTGAVGVWDGVIIRTHEMMPSTLISGSDYYAESFLMGQQGLAWVWGKRPKMVMEQFDYEDEVGVAFNFICGVIKPRFSISSTTYDYGILGMPSAYTNLVNYTA